MTKKIAILTKILPYLALTIFVILKGVDRYIISLQYPIILWSLSAFLVFFPFVAIIRFTAKGHTEITLISLMIPVWLYSMAYVCCGNLTPLQEAENTMVLHDKGTLIIRKQQFPGFLDPVCSDYIYYRPKDGFFRESIAELPGCTEREISEITLSNKLILLSVTPGEHGNKLFIRSDRGKWQDKYMSGDRFKSFEVKGDHFILEYEGFDYNAGSNAIIKYKLSADGRKFTFTSETLVETPGCKEIKRVYENCKKGDAAARYKAVTQISSIGGLCVRRYLMDFAYSDEDPAVKQRAQQGIAQVSINEQYERKNAKQKKSP